MAKKPTRAPTRARAVRQSIQPHANERRPSTSLVVVDRSGRELDTAERDRRQQVGDQLALALKQFHTVSNAESQLREDMADDMRFAASEQWDSDTLSEREADQRPAMTINRLSQFVRQVVNQIRIARQGVEVITRGGGAQKDTAEVFQGIIREIQEESDALRVYVTAAEAQARMGRGYWRVSAEWDPEGGFRQFLRLKRVRNPLLIFMDPAGQEIDGSDARFGFVVQDMPKDLYREKFGAVSMASLEEFRSNNSEYAQDWMPEGRVRIAEWWRVDTVADEELLLRWPDEKGQIVHKSLFDEWPAATRALCVIVKRRPLDRKVVRCALINAVEILEGNDDLTDGQEVPGSRIPIFPVIGEELDLNGRVDYRGMIRDAKDSQRMYNYESSALIEILALAPKAPYIGFAGQFENHETKWNQANRRNFAYLEVNPKSVDGNLLPMPQRTVIDPGISAIARAIGEQDNNLQATMGMYDPSLGRRQGNQSGRAINALQQQGEIANSNFQDNLMAAIRATGRYLIETIPHYYDIPTVLRIMGVDDKPRTVMVHAGQPPDADGVPDGVEGIYDLSVGRYDVVVTVGPSLATKRQEATQGLIQIMQANPQVANLLMDLVVENMDWPGAQTAAKRLKQALPPQLQEDGDQPAQLPPQVTAQIQQMQQALQQGQIQVQQVTDALQKAQHILDQKQIEREISHFEWSTRLQIAELESGRKAQTEAERTRVAAMAEQHEGHANRVHERILSAQEHHQELETAAVKAALVAKT